MRIWKGGVLVEKEDGGVLTGTACRQKFLPRLKHDMVDSDESEPFGPRQALLPLVGASSYDCSHIGVKKESRCVYQYNERYTFSRVIRGRDLCFSSHFEGGNLLAASRRELSSNPSYVEYDLSIHQDVHSNGHRQYFYFKVSNINAGMTVKFNIGDFTKPKSLYSRGLMPLFYSEKIGWKRVGKNISYHPKKALTPGGKPSRRQILSFTYTFEESLENCFFASSLPFTYTDLQDHLHHIQLKQAEQNKTVLRRSLLCQTLGGNRCDLLTVTEPTSSLPKLRERLGVLITARVHPGETNASWICRGLIDFLIGDSSEATELRKRFVFKIIPMLNPDGVINGNYRTSLSGSDLNRRWNDPHPIYHPTIFKTKELLRKFQMTNQIVTTCDIHGHSRREGAFVYGCRSSIIASNSCKSNKLLSPSPFLFPRILDEQCQFFSLSGCTFKSQNAKAATMRIVMNREFGIACSYTLEASLSGYKGFHFSSKDLQTIGSDYCLALLKFHNVQYGTISKEISSPTRTPRIQHDPNQDKETIDNSDIIIAVDEDSGGSDSNPSEDNLSESEALNLLSNSDIQKPKRKKKIKKRRKSKNKKKLKSVNSSDLRRLSAAKKCSNISLELNRRLSGITRLDQENQDITVPSTPGSKDNPNQTKSLTMLTFPLDEY